MATLYLALINDFHQIESPQVSERKTPKGMSSCPKRGTGQGLRELGLAIVKPPLARYGLTN
jgi:hypothetical protein